MTCITSNVDQDQGLQPSSKGDSEGPLYREGVYFEQYNSIITSAAANQASNECFELNNTSGTTFTTAAILSGYSVASGNVIACSEALKDAGDPAFDLTTWFGATNTAVAALPATVITDLSDANPRKFITAPTMTDGTTAAIPFTVYDVTELQDDFQAQALPAIGASGDSTFFESVNFIGAVKTGEDWVSSWTVGF